VKALTGQLGTAISLFHSEEASTKAQPLALVLPTACNLRTLLLEELLLARRRSLSVVRHRL